MTSNEDFEHFRGHDSEHAHAVPPLELLHGEDDPQVTDDDGGLGLTFL